MTKPTPEQVEEIARMLFEDKWKGYAFPKWASAEDWQRDMWREQARMFIASCEAQP